jgi:hypothetical protein
MNIINGTETCQNLCKEPSIHADLFVILSGALAGAGGGKSGGVQQGREAARDNVLVLQNLEPAFAETFNRQGLTFSQGKSIFYSDFT